MNNVTIQTSIILFTFSSKCKLVLKSTLKEYVFEFENQLELKTSTISVGSYQIFINGSIQADTLLILPYTHDVSRHKAELTTAVAGADFIKTSVSVVIPTYNAGDFFETVLTSIENQSISPEIVIVDSGSTDTTIPIIKAHKKKNKNIHLYCIEKKDFHHGRTRNFGISKTKGEYVALLTQDSLPFDSYWLQNLVKPMIEDSEIAGTFGPHLPYENTQIVEQLRILQKFDKIERRAKLVSEKIFGPIDDLPEQQRLLLIEYYSNSCCIRKSVWNKLPYPDVPWAEDRAWSQLIIKEGYKKYYAQDSIIYHSHYHNYRAYYKRWYESTYKICFTDITTHFRYRKLIYIFKTIAMALFLVVRTKYSFFRKIVIFTDEVIRIIIKYAAGRKALKDYRNTSKTG